MPRILFLALTVAVVSCASSGASVSDRPLSVPPLPHQRHAHQVCVIDDRVIAFGGYSRTPERGRGNHETWIYHLPGAGSVSEGWQRAADLNHGHAVSASVVVDGVIYAISRGIERYDAEADRWDVGEIDGVLPRTHFGAAALGRRIYTLGGFPTERAGFTVVDLDTGAVEQAPALPGFAAGDHFHLVTELNDELHVLGGFGEDLYDQHWVFDGRAWRRAAPVPVGFLSKIAIHGVFDDELYLFTMRLASRYDKASDQWSPVTGPGAQLVMPGLVTIGSRLVALGGMGFDESGESEVAPGLWTYDVKNDSWSH